MSDNCRRSDAAREKPGVEVGGQGVLMLPGFHGSQQRTGMHAAQNMILKVLVGLQPGSGNPHKPFPHHWLGYSHVMARVDTSADKDDMAAGVWQQQCPVTSSHPQCALTLWMAL